MPRPKKQEPPKKLNLKSTAKNVVEKQIPTCYKCGKSNKTDFYISHNPRYQYYGRIPFCKHCIVEDFKIYFEKTEHPITALFFTFQKIDAPLISSILNSFEISELEIPERIVSKYFRQYNSFYESQYEQYITFDDTDVLIEDSGGYEKVNEFEDIDLKEMQFKWGTGYTLKEYDYLEKRYESLIDMTDESSLYESDKMLFKEIAHAEINIRRLREKGSDTTKQVDGLQKLMQSASIRSSDMKQAKAGALKESYGIWIEDIENYEPAEFFEKRAIYSDFDGFLKYLKTWVLRPLKNLLSGSRDFDLEGDN